MRTQTVAAFHDSETSSDNSLLIVVPDNQAAHNQFTSTPSSSIYTEQNLPTLFNYPMVLTNYPSAKKVNLLMPSDIASILLEGNPITNPSQIIASISMATPMPISGKHATPVFNSSKLKKIMQYFNQLEDLFNRCQTQPKRSMSLPMSTLTWPTPGNSFLSIEMQPRHTSISKIVCSIYGQTTTGTSSLTLINLLVNNNVFVRFPLQ